MAKSLFPQNPIVIADDEPNVLLSFSTELRMNGINNIVTFSDPRKVIPLLMEREVEAIFLDITMPNIQGDDLLKKIVEEFPGIPVIMVTGTHEVETAVKCMKSGAFDYLTKPLDEGRLITTARKALNFKDMQREISSLKEQVLSGRIKTPQAFSSIITEAPAMKSIFRYVDSIASTLQPVLITGETGTGKTLIARAIHELSTRDGNFTSVNVAGLDDTLFSDTLFGHERGAFTGAHKQRSGLVEKASGGTLFLDEIGDLAIGSQVKLLDLLQEHEYLPIGTDEPRNTDARIIVATNADLQELKRTDKFRNDLYYRLITHHIHLPPLRERLGDIHRLLDHFLDKASGALGKKRPTPPPELFILLATYHFPGNVRELEAMIFDAVSRHKSKMLSMQVFKDHIKKETPAQDLSVSTKPDALYFSNLSTLPTLKDAASALVEESLKRSQGNISIASKLLGISRQALSKRIKSSNT